MSRTIRRKNVKLPRWITHKHVRIEGLWVWEWIPRSKKELAKERASFYSDNTGSTKYYCSTSGRKEWLLTFQNTERRSARDQLRKYMLDEEDKVMINPNRPFLDYWD